LTAEIVEREPNPPMRVIDAPFDLLIPRGAPQQSCFDSGQSFVAKVGQERRPSRACGGDPGLS
jgi:hypothetical protein